MMQKEVADRITAVPGHEGIRILLNCNPVLYGRRSFDDCAEDCIHAAAKCRICGLQLTRKAEPPAEVIDEEFLFQSGERVICSTKKDDLK